MSVASHFCDNHPGGYCRDAGGSHLSRVLETGARILFKMRNPTNKRQVLASFSKSEEATASSEYREEDKLEIVPDLSSSWQMTTWGHSYVMSPYVTFRPITGLYWGKMTNQRRGLCISCDMWHCNALRIPGVIKLHTDEVVDILKGHTNGNCSDNYFLTEVDDASLLWLRLYFDLLVINPPLWVIRWY